MHTSKNFATKKIKNLSMATNTQTKNKFLYSPENRGGQIKVYICRLDTPLFLNKLFFAFRLRFARSHSLVRFKV